METNSNYSTNGEDKTEDKMLSESTKGIMDFYTKQLNVATSFYKNLFDSFSTGNKVWNNSPDYTTGFLNNDIKKAFDLSFSGMRNNFTNPFLPTFDKLFKQMVDYNTTMFTNLTKGFNDSTNLSEISNKYQDIVNIRMEASKKIIKNATEAYIKQLDFSLENNKKAIEELNNQVNTMVKQNQKFWSDLMETTKAPLNNEGNIVKDFILPEIKKRTTVPANELSNHNA